MAKKTNLTIEEVKEEVAEGIPVEELIEHVEAIMPDDNIKEQFVLADVYGLTLESSKAINAFKQFEDEWVLKFDDEYKRTITKSDGVELTELLGHGKREELKFLDDDDLNYSKNNIEKKQ